MPSLSCLVCCSDLLKVSKERDGSVRGQGFVCDQAKSCGLRTVGWKACQHGATYFFLNVSVLTGTLPLASHLHKGFNWV